VSESRSITIANEADIINARLQTRQMAKDAGLSTMDQARISLAVSSLAHIIHLGEHHRGQIVLNRITDARRSGVQVIWMLDPDCNIHQMAQELHNSTMQQMVHELKVQTNLETGVCITAVMWTSPPTGNLIGIMS